MSEPEVTQKNEAALCIFSRSKDILPLKFLQEALMEMGYPASLSINAAGDCTDEELESTDWDAVFLRWKEPELHDICLLEWDNLGDLEPANDARAAAALVTIEHPDEAGRWIVQGHLADTKVVYSCSLMPPLVDDEDHPGWEALDCILREVAANTDGIIYGGEDLFFDEEGDPLLQDPNEPDDDKQA